MLIHVIHKHLCQILSADRLAKCVCQTHGVMQISRNGIRGLKILVMSSCSVEYYSTYKLAWELYVEIDYSEICSILNPNYARESYIK
jgi:hypothetical protein